MVLQGAQGGTAQVRRAFPRDAQPGQGSLGLKRGQPWLPKHIDHSPAVSPGLVDFSCLHVLVFKVSTPQHFRVCEHASLVPSWYLVSPMFLCSAKVQTRGMGLVCSGTLEVGTPGRS